MVETEFHVGRYQKLWVSYGSPPFNCFDPFLGVYPELYTHTTQLECVCFSCEEDRDLMDRNEPTRAERFILLALSC